jgi:phosphoribosyl-ATP pyrophosphohydrolase
MTTLDQLFLAISKRYDGTELTAAQKSHAIHEQGKSLIKAAGAAWISSEHGTKSEVTDRAAELIYYLQEMLVSRGVSLTDLHKAFDRFEDAVTHEH